MSAVLQPNELVFRSMQEEDLDQVMEIECSGHSFPWSRGIFIDCLRIGYSARVIEADNYLKAFAIMSACAGEAHLLNLCVRRSEQGQGLGGMLLLHMLGFAAQRDADIMFLEVRPSNAAAIYLYENNGFSVVGERKSYYPAARGREDALVMSRELPPVNDSQAEG